jgi:nickel-dependent lactate racemase
VSRIEEKAVAVRIGHIVGIVAQEFGEKHRDEIRAAHGSARVARFRLFNHRGRQNADIVGDTRKFGICR